jgi:hypothetical protein
MIRQMRKQNSFALKRTNNYFKIFIEKLSTGGPRHSRGFHSKKVPRIPKPQISSPILT